MAPLRTPADVLRARGKLGPYTVVPAAVLVDGDSIDPAVVRAWAAEHGIEVATRGKLPASVVERYQAWVQQ